MNHDKLTSLLSSLPSQTSLDERFGLYDLGAKTYTGKGYIYDIGTAAGGSTYCLALVLNRNRKLKAAAKRGRILGFDLFAGYALRSFQNSTSLSKLQEKHKKELKTDLEFFEAVTHDFRKYIKPIKANLIHEFSNYRNPEKIEIVHIDAANSLDLWRTICPVICEGAIPGLTTFIFQDFERARLPFQWMFIAELLNNGIARWVGQFDGGTIHLRIEKPIPAEIVENSMAFSYSQDRAVALWKSLYEFISSDHDRMKVFRGAFENIANATLAYIFLYLGQHDLREESVGKIDEAFLDKESIYKQELTSGKIISVF